ncbi:MAG: MFS transporter [Chloroflexi bacterium]|nr:MFS transporter [Chloroflexota bacterium]
MRYLSGLDRNGRLLLAGKAVRSFAAGLNAVALGLYLEELGVTGSLLGLILTGALVGTMLLTGFVAIRGDRVGRRRLLIAGGLLMGLAALIPLAVGSPILLALLGLSGVVTVTSNESTGLQSVDQAAMPQTVPPGRRTAAFAAYNVVAAVAAALGALAVGPAAAFGEALGLAGAQRYAPCFVAFAACGAVAAALAATMDERIEAPRRADPGMRAIRGRGPIGRLSALYGLDSFASGLAVQSFLAFWFASRFGLPPDAIGLLFGAGHVLAAASFPVASALSARIGLIRTMVFTHIPSSMFLIGMAVVPWAPVAAVLYLARAGLAQMDVPARQSYTMSIVEPDERTAAAAITNLAKSAAQTAGPVVAGSLLIPLGIGVPLIGCGVLKICYDLALFAGFRGRPAPDEVA